MSFFTEELESYKDAFVRNYHRPYGIQRHKGSWEKRKYNITDAITQGHLRGDYWAGIVTAWYNAWGLIDFDGDKLDIVHGTIDRLGLREGQYLLCTSPSYEDDGSTHLIIKPEYECKPPTAKRFQLTLKKCLQVKSGTLEVYPNNSSLIRLPFGAKQFIISDGYPRINMSWQDKLYWFDKVEPFDLSTVSASFSEREYTKNTEWYTPPDVGCKNEGAFLYQEGLQEVRTRHNATQSVVIWLFSQNYPPECTVEIVKEWIRKKGNGNSRTVNAGRWMVIDRDIEEIVDWVYKQFVHLQVLPDSIHNGLYSIRECDLEFIAEHFGGDLRNQKRMFKLISYFRPRMKYEWVFCPQTIWIKIARANEYKEFQEYLEKRGILEVDPSYRAASFPFPGYPKKFRLHLPNLKHSSELKSDGRIITDFREAVRMRYVNPREARDRFGLPLSTVQEWYK